MISIVLISSFSVILSSQVDYSCLHEENWLINQNNHYNQHFKAYTDVLGSGPSSQKKDWVVTYTGVPNYDRTFTQSDISKLNSRPQASSDFKNGKTTAKVGNFYVWGDDIGYVADSSDPMENECMGYWPPGPVCPNAMTQTSTFSLYPAKEMGSGCYTGLGTIGLAINGIAIFNWADGSSYQEQNSWYDNAGVFEYYDMDVCGGHAAQGTYHQHFHPNCLAEILDDKGTGHSPLYGFANDGFPIYGPYQAAGQLASPCWKTRDYSSSTKSTGCSDGQRSCKMIDPFDSTKGTTTSGVKRGPSFTEVVLSQSSNSFVAKNGIYYEDYYYDSTCFAQGGIHLNEFNGHDHDNYGFHYHITVNGTFQPLFPYIVGPKFYGCLSGTNICSGPSGLNDYYSSSSSICGQSIASNPQCLAITLSSAVTDPNSVGRLSNTGVIVTATISGCIGALIVGLVWYSVYRSRKNSLRYEPLLTEASVNA